MIDPFYEKLLRSTIFRMDAEEAHELTIHGLGWMSRLKPLCRWLHSINGSTAKDPVRLFGLNFQTMLVWLRTGQERTVSTCVCCDGLWACGGGNSNPEAATGQ